jgi:cell wall-associated NlpC family hydrolase
MTTLQERVVASARGWLGTRFHHQGRLKKTDTHKGGVDCLGLLVGVAAELGLKSKTGDPIITYDRREYTHTPDTTQLKNVLEAILEPVPIEGICEADTVLMNVDGRPQHMGIVSNLSNNPGLIHAYAPARAVVEHPMDTFWSGRIVAAFRLHGINN